MIVVGRFYCYTRDDLDDHLKQLQRNDLNLDLPGITHLDDENKVMLRSIPTSVVMCGRCISTAFKHHFNRHYKIL